MKTLFDPATRTELQNRIQTLSSSHTALWGKMNVFQMTLHCNNWNNWVLGKGNYSNHVYKQELLGKIFGKMALKSNTKNDKPIGKGMPAGAFVVKEQEGDTEAQKALWIQGIDDYARFANERFVHDFFGKMSREQIGIFAYKHFDHHLRQFGV